MALDLFLQFVGASPTGINVVGESVDKSHPQAVAVNAVEFGVENPTTIGSTSAGAGAGKVKFESVKVSKNVDSASTALFQALASGAHFPVMKLFVRRAGGTTPSDYAVYQFNMVFIVNIAVSGDGGEDTLQETVEMTYGALQMSYAPMTATGALGKQQIATWNQVTNMNTLDMPFA
jgi:type VI secretion system secreted protein Hcp